MCCGRWKQGRGRPCFAFHVGRRLKTADSQPFAMDGLDVGIPIANGTSRGDDQLADLSPGPVVRPRSREGSCIDCLRLGPRKRLSPDVSACRNSEIKDHEDRCGASCTDNELFAQAEIDLDHTGNLGTEGTPTEREHRKDDANL